jgi:hypothetical protein
MNIFYLDHDVSKCAMMHNDKHCVKMILEYAQLLSTAHRVLDGNVSVGLSKTGRKQTRYVLSDNREHLLYSATHINHPSATWVRQSKQNYDWLHDLLCKLCAEYTYRYGKVHKVERDGLLAALFSAPLAIPSTAFTEPTPAMPDDLKVPGDSINSYRSYYNIGKTHLAKWKNRPVPYWFSANNFTI